MSRTHRKDHFEDDPYHVKKSSRDKKKWYKPPKSLKKLTKKQERAKTHDYLHHIEEDEDQIDPRFKKHNNHDWN